MLTLCCLPCSVAVEGAARKGGGGAGGEIGLLARGGRGGPPLDTTVVAPGLVAPAVDESPLLCCTEGSETRLKKGLAGAEREPEAGGLEVERSSGERWGGSKRLGGGL